MCMGRFLWGGGEGVGFFNLMKYTFVSLVDNLTYSSANMFYATEHTRTLR